MGKRRTEGKHKSRYNESDSDEVEDEIIEQEPLKPDQLANIKSRKIIKAKRRGPSTTETSTFGAFGALTKAGTEESSKPSVFTGFKGFSAFKAAPSLTPATNEPAKTVASMFSETTPSTDAFKSTPSITPSLFASKSNSNTVNKPSLFSQSANGDHKHNDLPDSKEVSKKLEPEKTNDTSSNNISETELNFINELNVVYEKYYGKTKRALKLPTEVLDKDMNSGDKPEDSTRSKYAFLLAELNKHCSKWISKHVEKDPLIILTPIFVDYFNYMILMEKNFYPNTFSKIKPSSESATNGTTPQQFSLKPSNGTAIVASVNTTTTPTLSFSSTNSFASNKKDDESHKNINGHKEETDKENEDTETDKKLSDSSKNFASLIKTNQINPISLTGSSVTAAFSLKSSSESPKLAEKDSNSATPTTQTNLFKFSAGSPSKNTQSLSGTETAPKSNFFSSEPKKDQEPSAAPKLSFASSSSETTTVKPTFKFGASTEMNKPSLTESPSIFGKKPESSTTSFFGKPAESLEAKKTETPLLSVFGKTVDSSSILGKKTDSTTPFLFAKTTETTPLFGKSTDKTSPTSKQPTPSLFSKTEAETETKTSSIFSSLNKPPTTAPLTTENEDGSKKPSSETESKPAAPTFTSLMNANANTTPGSTFKGFNGFGGSSSQSSIFSSSSTAAPGSNVTTSKPATPFFSFASAADAAKPGGLFEAGTTGSNLFGSGATFPGATAQPQQEEEEEYVPPKPETSDVKEEGAVFERRIKLYYEKEEKFVDRGIGNLYIKPINNGESMSLIVRADNKLANILLNVKLSKSLPVSKIGAKDVSFLCMPNPAIPGVDEKKPCKFLFKVKTEEWAQELLDKLNEYKK